MFSQIGPGEIILVLAIALIVLGPKRLPSAARSIGHGLREFKHSLSEVDPREAEQGADRCGDERALGVVDDLRRDETQPPPARLDVDRARREHVAHPLAVSAVGQGDDVAVAVAEEVDRRAVDATGAAPDVREDREAGKPAGERPEDTVRDVKVEPREALGQRHRMPVSRMMGASDPRPRAPR